MLLTIPLRTIMLSLLLCSNYLPAQPQKDQGVSEKAKKAANLSKVIDAVQKQYNSTKAATFGFEQIYKKPFPIESEPDLSRGVVKYSRAGGRMIWNYLERRVKVDQIWKWVKDRQKTFYINGNRFTYYSIDDKIAYTHDCYDQETLPASVAFLLGSGNLRQSFAISLIDPGTENKALTWLELIPKEKNSPVKRLLLGVDRAHKVVESIVLDPTNGKNHFKFFDFKVVQKLPESIFVFHPPKGVKLEPVPNMTCPKKANKR